MTDKPKCPKCGSDCIQEITNASRCGQCGFQFGLERDPIGRAARGEAEKPGYPKRSAHS